MVRKLCAIKGRAGAKVISWSLSLYYLPSPIQHEEKGTQTKTEKWGERNLRCGPGSENPEIMVQSRKAKWNLSKLGKGKNWIGLHNNKWNLQLTHGKILLYFILLGMSCPCSSLNTCDFVKPPHQFTKYSSFEALTLWYSIELIK